MTTLKEACEIVLKKCPGYYVHAALEFESGYDIRVTHIGVAPGGTPVGFAVSYVDKKTGKYEFTDLGDDRVQGEYIWHSKEEIDKLLKSK